MPRPHVTGAGSATAPTRILNTLLHSALPLLCSTPLGFYRLRLPQGFEFPLLPERLAARPGIGRTWPFDGPNSRPIGRPRRLHQDHRAGQQNAGRSNHPMPITQEPYHWAHSLQLGCPRARYRAANGQFPVCCTSMPFLGQERGSRDRWGWNCGVRAGRPYRHPRSRANCDDSSPARLTKPRSASISQDLKPEANAPDASAK